MYSNTEMQQTLTHAQKLPLQKWAIQKVGMICAQRLVVQNATCRPDASPERHTPRSSNKATTQVP